MKNFPLLLTLFFCQMLSNLPAQQPLRIGVVGLNHDHVNWILGRAKANDIEIVGIVEPNRAPGRTPCQKAGL